MVDLAETVRLVKSSWAERLELGRQEVLQVIESFGAGLSVRWHQLEMAESSVLVVAGTVGPVACLEGLGKKTGLD